MAEYQSMAEHKATKAAAQSAPVAVSEPAAVVVPTPTETPVIPAVAETTPEPAVTTEPAVETPESHRDTAAEKRIAKLTKDRESARREAEDAKTKTAYLLGLLDAKPPQVATSDVPVIDPNLLVAEQVKALMALEKEKERKAAAAEKASAAITSARVKHPDLESLEQETHINLPDALLAEIQASDCLDELYYHLISHPDEAHALGSMPHSQAVKTLGRLEERLSSAPAKPAPKTPALPPPPLSPLKTNTAPSTAKVHKYTSY